MKLAFFPYLSTRLFCLPVFGQQLASESGRVTFQYFELAVKLSETSPFAHVNVFRAPEPLAGHLRWNCSHFESSPCFLRIAPSTADPQLSL